MEQFETDCMPSHASFNKQSKLKKTFSISSKRVRFSLEKESPEQIYAFSSIYKWNVN